MHEQIVTSIWNSRSEDELHKLFNSYKLTFDAQLPSGAMEAACFVNPDFYWGAWEWISTMTYGFIPVTTPVWFLSRFPSRSSVWRTIH